MESTQETDGIPLVIDYTEAKKNIQTILTCYWHDGDGKLPAFRDALKWLLTDAKNGERGVIGNKALLNVLETEVVPRYLSSTPNPLLSHLCAWISAESQPDATRLVSAMVAAGFELTPLALCAMLKRFKPEVDNPTGTHQTSDEELAATLTLLEKVPFMKGFDWSDDCGAMAPVARESRYIAALLIHIICYRPGEGDHMREKALVIAAALVWKQWPSGNRHNVAEFFPEHLAGFVSCIGAKLGDPTALVGHSTISVLAHILKRRADSAAAWERVLCQNAAQNAMTGLRSLQLTFFVGGTNRVTAHARDTASMTYLLSLEALVTSSSIYLDAVAGIPCTCDFLVNYGAAGGIPVKLACIAVHVASRLLAEAPPDARSALLTRCVTLLNRDCYDSERGFPGAVPRVVAAIQIAMLGATLEAQRLAIAALLNSLYVDLAKERLSHSEVGYSPVWSRKLCDSMTTTLPSTLVMVLQCLWAYGDAVKRARTSVDLGLLAHAVLKDAMADVRCPVLAGGGYEPSSRAKWTRLGESEPTSQTTPCVRTLYEGVSALLEDGTLCRTAVVPRTPTAKICETDTVDCWACTGHEHYAVRLLPPPETAEAARTYVPMGCGHDIHLECYAHIVVNDGDRAECPGCLAVASTRPMPLKAADLPLHTLHHRALQGVDLAEEAGVAP